MTLFSKPRAQVESGLLMKNGKQFYFLGYKYQVLFLLKLSENSQIAIIVREKSTASLGGILRRPLQIKHTLLSQKVLDFAISATHT